MNKKIFLSYCWSDSEDVNRIDNIFSRFGISLTRDDLIKKDNRMNIESLDMENLFDVLDVKKEYPDIITEDVFNWIEKYPRANLSTLISLIHDLYQSTRVISSEFANIPDDEKPYYFKDFSFFPSQNGIELHISVQNIRSGVFENIIISQLVEIVRNTNSNNIESKFYFYCENPSKKQQWMEVDKKRKHFPLTKEEEKLHESKYYDVRRIRIRFD